MAVNCRSILKSEPGRSSEEDFKIMLGKFRKKLTDSGILTVWKKHQYYESKGERKRRKKKESHLKHMKESSRIT